MGMVGRSASGVGRLLLYRYAVQEGGEEEVDVLTVIEGYAADVRCSVCGELRTWVPGSRAVRRAMRDEAGR